MGFSHQDATDSNDNTLVSLANTAQLDAFGRLRVSYPQTLFDSHFRYDLLPTIFDTSTATGGTVVHDANKVSAKLSTTTSSGSSAIIQSKLYIPYQPGKSLRCLMTGNMGAKKTNVRKRWGLFDEDNGVFFEQDGSNLKVVVRSSVSGSVVDTAVNQSSWNMDPLNGQGPSRVTLDETLQQIWAIDYQYLGSGRIRFGLNINGHTLIVHEVFSANILSTPWCQSGSNPIRVEITNTAAAASATDIFFTCSEASSEGGYSPDGVIRYVSNGTTLKSVGGTGTLVPLISLRKASAFVKTPFELLEFGAFMNTVDDAEMIVIMNATLTGASWVAASGLGEIDVSSTAVSGGYTIYGTYIRGASSTPSLTTFNSFQRKMFVGKLLNGNSETVTIAAKNITSASNMLGRILYKEII